MLRQLSKLWRSLTRRTSDDGQENSIYVDLAPTDKADPSGIYSSALIYATNNRNVRNIALTGPYGSGKSSIIKTFLGRYRKFWFFKKPVLQISLAAFLPEADSVGGTVSKQEIERSILQQMLYGADANSLPLSRFKRIQSPKMWTPLVSLVILLGVAACWYLIQQRIEIFNGSFFLPLDFSNWFNLASFTFAFLFVWYALHQIYIKSFGIALKSISLKDIEITPETTGEESILNRHLDEIIYFFQSTEYDLVIIEDLDRFNNPDIFVTLREINSLINANAGVKRQIRFLYALRDNMFLNTDRTKFFEFIVPVIPIINASNSIDKVIEQGERLSLTERLDRQFLREVSRYLNDLRLIQNIFNEYAIYVKNLETDEENILDANKLLAILIYKNVLPSDFEELHREKGKLAGILSKHDVFIKRAEMRLKLEISELEQKISDAEKQVPSDLEELRRVYCMALVDKLPAGYTGIQINGSWIPIQSLWSHNDFDQLLEAQHILCRFQNHTQRVQIEGLQAEVNADQTFRERKQAIENKSEAHKDKASKSIRVIRTKLSKLRTTRFNEIIREHAGETEDLFKAFGESGELIKFLVFEGFLDDSYYQYTSLFHSGRLSPNDNKFLIQIRAFNNPEPDFQIDNPKEVIAAMRDDDFRQELALNAILVDCMFDNAGEYDQQISMLLGFISSNFDECHTFFTTYYERGKRIPELTSQLLDTWPGFISAVLEGSGNVTHVARLVAHLPEKRLKSLGRKDRRISEFLANNLAQILALEIDFDPERLLSFSFEVQDLTSILPYPAIARLLTHKGLYEITSANIEVIFNGVLGIPNGDGLQSKNYSTILMSGDETLIQKIEDNFDQYIDQVLLATERNVEEDVATVIKILNHDEIEDERLETFLAMQTVKLPSLDGIPERLHAALFRMQKIEASWANCLAFVSSESFDPKTLTTFLMNVENQTTLSSSAMDQNDSASPLRKFLLNNNDLEENVYRRYVRMLPRQFREFPSDLDPAKLHILVEEERIEFSQSSFSQLANHIGHQVLFVAKNFQAYSKSKERFSLDDEFREKLLKSETTDDQKLKITEDIDVASISSSSSLAAIIGEILYRTGKEMNNLSPDAAQAIIANSKPIAAQISLFNRFKSVLSDDQVWNAIHSLPRPFSDIKPGYSSTRIPNTPENLEFVNWLQARSIISSWKFTFLEEDIRIHPFRR